MLNSLRAELDLCISTCNELKDKIDLKLKKLQPPDKRDSKAASEEDYKIQMDIRRLKADHKDFLDEYKALKKKYRQEDMNLLLVKRKLLESFEDHLSKKMGRARDPTHLGRPQDMDAAEIVFMNAKERFQTIK
mgnify:CR=1 FL=1